MQFIRNKDGDFIRAAQIAICSPNPDDESVPDSAEVVGVLTGGFGIRVKCGDLRQALGITFDAAPTEALRQSAGARP